MLLPPKMWNVEQVAEWVTLQSVDSGLRQYAAVRVFVDNRGRKTVPQLRD